MAKQYHIQLDDGDCAQYVLLPGDPGRVETVADTWDTSRKIAENREYVTYTGEYKDVPITCTSTGIGASSTAIACRRIGQSRRKDLSAYRYLRYISGTGQTWGHGNL